jgi:hypothetical protein
MAKVIEFYDSDSLAKTANYKARKEPGKLIEFHASKGNRPTRILLNGRVCVWHTLRHSSQTLGAEMAMPSGPQAKRLVNPDKEPL